ncbi:ABC transporter permease subunit [Escherichia coli]|nr:ABC transporter permease subunit [Escherichia coli]
MDLEWFSGDDRFVDLRTGLSLSSSVHFFGILRTVPNRFLSGLGTLYVELFRNVPLIVQFFTWYLVIPELLPEKIGMWFKAELDPNIQFFPFIHALPGGCLPPPVFANRYAPLFSRCRVGKKNAALAMGLTLPQAYRYVLLPNAYRVIVPPMTSEMMNLVKNSAIASTIGLVDMAAQAGKLLDYSAHAWESFTAITLAYVLINAFIMLVMTLVERKVRLPGNMGGANNVRV